MSTAAVRDVRSGTSRRWSEAQQLFEQALERPESEREAYVRNMAQGDLWLGKSVLDLLVLDGGSSPLDRPPPHCSEAPWLETEVTVGDQVGKYRLLERIGVGGMGSVYRAEHVDGSVRQEVAVKVLHATHLSHQGQQRFLQEQRIMAGLRHPQIAQLLDFGSTPSGIAYLVMNLLEGTSITEYADEQELSIVERIRLFLQVCNAVRHAHRRLVVHRDLKPANVLVSSGGELHLVDFGIAKLLDPEEHLGGMVTRTEQRVMTPNYASPEQLFGQPITTGTDVWALGVLLFELLVGRRPFDWAGMSLVDIERHLELGPGPKASASLPMADDDTTRMNHRRGLDPGCSRRHLRGDLDMVIGRALAYRPGERYGSVEALAVDLERYLAGLPILARRHNVVYTVGKFIRRHALAVTGLAIGMFFLVGFFILQIMQSQRLTTERDLARQQRDKAQLMSDLLADVLDLADPSNKKLNRAAQTLLDQGTQRILKDFGEQPEAQADLLTRVGILNQRLGDYDEAEELLTRAAEIWQHEGNVDLEGVARTLDSLGHVYYQKRDPRALETLRHGLKMAWQAHGGDHPDVARLLMHIATILRYNGEDHRSESLLRRAIAMDGRLENENTAEAGARLANLAALVRRRGGRQEALALFDRALEIQRAAWGEHSVQVAGILNRKAFLFAERPYAEEGARLLHMATDIFRDLLGDDHPRVATGLNNLANMYILFNNFEQAESFQRQAWERDIRSLGDEHPSTLEDRRGLAMILREAGRLSEAEEHIRRSVTVLARVIERDNPDLISQRNDFARILLEQGLQSQAAEQLDLALEVVVPKMGDHWLTGSTYIGLAELALQQGNHEAAQAHASEALRIFEEGQVGSERWRLAEAKSALGAALVALGRESEGERHLRAAVESLLELRGPSVATRLAEARLHELRVSRVR